MEILGKMDIYKHRGESCSNSGISSKYDEVIIVDEFNADAAENAVVIIKDKIINNSIERIRAVPANSKGKWDMFGGCFIYTSNGIVPYAGLAIKLHDRFE